MLYLKNYIFNIFFWLARSKEEDILHGYSFFLHRGFLIFVRYYSRNTRRTASRRPRRASMQHRCAAAFIHSFIHYLTTARGLVIAFKYPSVIMQHIGLIYDVMCSVEVLVFWKTVQYLYSIVLYCDLSVFHDKLTAIPLQLIYLLF